MEDLLIKKYKIYGKRDNLKMKYENLYKVRPIKDLKDMLNSSTELYGDKAAFLDLQTQKEKRV